MKIISVLLSALLIFGILFSATAYAQDGTDPKYISEALCDDTAEDEELDDETDDEGDDNEEGEEEEDNEEGEDEEDNEEGEDEEDNEEGEDEEDNENPVAAFEYAVKEDNTVIITGYDSADQNPVVPEEIDSYPVNEIGKDAFALYPELESVELPLGVTAIAPYSIGFVLSTDNLTYIKLEDFTLFGYAGTAAEEYASRYGIEFELIEYTEIFEDDDYEYELDENGNAVITLYIGDKENVIIPSTLGGRKVVAIEECAFEDIGTIISVTIPDTVITIGERSFSGCDELVEIKLGKGVKTIGEEAFAGCVELCGINLPDGLKTIGDSAFMGCAELSQVSLPESLQKIGDSAFEDCESIEKIVIPDSVTSLGENAFSGCSSAKTISIGSGVTQIKEGTFAGCSSIKSLTIPPNVTSVQDDAFKDCSSLTSVSVPKTLKTADSAFEGIKLVTRVSLKKKSATIYTGQSLTLKPTVTNPIGSTGFSSSAKKVAKVSEKGVISALKKGKTTITVKNNGVKAKFTVTVKNPYFKKTVKSLKIGKSFTLKIVGKGKKVSFTTSSKKIAKVSKKGKITAKKKGKVTITAKTNGVKIKMKIKVK